MAERPCDRPRSEVHSFLDRSPRAWGSRTADERARVRGRKEGRVISGVAALVLLLVRCKNGTLMATGTKWGNARAGWTVGREIVNQDWVS